MHRFWIGSALWLLLPFEASSAEPSLPPTQQILRVDASGQWELQFQVTACKLETKVRSVTKRIPETKTVTETVDGKPVQRTVTQYKDVVETQQYTVSHPDYHAVTKQITASMLKAYETDGRSIPMDKLRSRVGTEALVVVSATDAKLSEAYANLFKPGTIVIALEKSQPAASVAAPVPSAPGAAPVVAPQPKMPQAVAPQFLMLGRSGMDDIVLRRISESTFPIKCMTVFKKGTTQEHGPIEMMQTLRQSESFTLAAKHLHFHVGENVDVPFERIKERIARESAVVYSTDGEAIDAFWLQNLKSSTLVVTGPQLPMPGACSPAPMMMPVPTNGPYAPATVPVPAPVQPAPAPNPMPQSSAVRRSPVLPAVETHIPFEPSAVERELVDLANSEREKAKLAPLIAEQHVTQTARTHAANMVKRNSLSHELDGQGVGERLKTHGFGWIKCGENIARGQDAPAEAIASWMNSPGHRANLLGPDYSHIGVAVFEGSGGQKYWTMVLAQAR